MIQLSQAPESSLFNLPWGWGLTPTGLVKDEPTLVAKNFGLGVIYTFFE